MHFLSSFFFFFWVEINFLETENFSNGTEGTFVSLIKKHIFVSFVFDSYFKVLKKEPILFWMQELYHELHALDRFELDYQRKRLEEEMSISTQKGNY